MSFSPSQWIHFLITQKLKKRQTEKKIYKKIHSFSVFQSHFNIHLQLLSAILYLILFNANPPLQSHQRLNYFILCYFLFYFIFFFAFKFAPFQYFDKEIFGGIACRTWNSRKAKWIHKERESRKMCIINKSMQNVYNILVVTKFMWYRKMSGRSRKCFSRSLMRLDNFRFLHLFFHKFNSVKMYSFFQWHGL